MELLTISTIVRKFSVAVWLVCKRQQPLHTFSRNASVSKCADVKGLHKGYKLETDNFIDECKVKSNPKKFKGLT
jgi:hypothetical protein